MGQAHVGESRPRGSLVAPRPGARQRVTAIAGVLCGLSGCLYCKVHLCSSYLYCGASVLSNSGGVVLICSVVVLVLYIRTLCHWSKSCNISMDNIYLLNCGL